jgi:WD40 repeat protein
VPFATLPPGSRLGRFQIVKRLGEGGMAVVYEAVDTGLGRTVALKVLPRETAQEDRIRRRFEREAKAAARVEHKNVVHVHFTGEEGGMRVLALELLTGGSLRDRMKAGPLPAEAAARFGAEIARGLEAIHAAGFVHRDLKPDNVLLDAAGRAKVSDFGLVTGEAEDQGRLTQSGDLMGTLDYMSPEQIDNAKDVDARADLYSLGALLYALVAGRPPFEGSGLALMKQQLGDRPKPPSSLVDGIPPALEKLVLRLLEKEPGARPGPAGAVASELEAIVASLARVETAPSARSLPVLALGVVLVIALGGGALALVATRGSTAATQPGEETGPSRDSRVPPGPPAPGVLPPARGAATPETGAETPAVGVPAPEAGTQPPAPGPPATEPAARPVFELVPVQGDAFDWKHAGSVHGLVLSHDGTRVASAANDGFAKVWDLGTGALVTSLAGVPPSVRMIAFSPDDLSLVAGGRGGKAVILGVADGKVARTLDTQGEAFIRCVVWGPDGRIVTGETIEGRGVPDRTTIHVWDPGSGTSTMKLDGTGKPWGYANGMTWVGGGRGGRVAVALGNPRGESGFVLDLDHATVDPILKNAELEGVASSAAGDLLAFIEKERPEREKSKGSPPRVRVFAYPGKEERATVALPRGPKPLGVAMSRDGSRIVVLTEPFLFLVEPGKSPEVRSVPLAPAWAIAVGAKAAATRGELLHPVVLTPDDKRVLTAHPDGRVRLWRLTD